MSATISTDHMAGLHVLHFKPAAGAVNNFLVFFQQ
jgi:hypothetical protein